MTPAPVCGAVKRELSRPFRLSKRLAPLVGEPRYAIELCEQSLAISREIGDRYREARASWNLGLALEKLGELGRAAAMKQVHIDYLRETGHRNAEKLAAEVEALRARMGAG